MVVSADAAAALYGLLRDGGVRCWVMGGWGVDALLGAQTRDHHDLDVLVLVDDLAELRRVLAERGFATKLVWEESRWLELEGEPVPSAFVAESDEGVELDVHVIEVGEDGAVQKLCDSPWPTWPGCLDGRGTIAGIPVACVTVGMQIGMHAGYELPPAHLHDLERLRRHAGE